MTHLNTPKWQSFNLNLNDVAIVMYFICLKQKCRQNDSLMLTCLRIVIQLFIKRCTFTHFLKTTRQLHRKWAFSKNQGWRPKLFKFIFVCFITKYFLQKIWKTSSRNLGEQRRLCVNNMHCTACSVNCYILLSTHLRMFKWDRAIDRQTIKCLCQSSSAMSSWKRVNANK